jgi:hypothetical protein
MTADKSQFVLLKLRSGDEIIAKKAGAKKGTILLHRPLQLQRSTFLDPLSGNIKKNICVFRDWLEFTTQIECEVPEDFIVVNGTPTPDMISRYLAELDKLDRQDKTNAAKPSAKKPSKTDLEATEDLLDEYFKALQMPSSDPKTPAQQQKSDTNLPSIPPNTSMVTASFSMPPDVFLNIVLNMPMFDGWGQEMDDDSSDMDDNGDDDSEGEPPSQPPESKPKPPSSKKKPNKGEDKDTPPDGWNGRFGFPK